VDNDKLQTASGKDGYQALCAIRFYFGAVSLPVARICISDILDDHASWVGTSPNCRMLFCISQNKADVT